MGWFRAITIIALVLCTLASAEDRIGFGKGHKKRGLAPNPASGIPTFSKGYDVSHVRHSILKPFLLKYPMHSVSVGVKIPVRPQQNHHHHVPVPHPTYGVPSAQTPTQLRPMAVKPQAPCPHPIVPVVPTTTVQIAPAAIPAPAFTPTPTFIPGPTFVPAPAFAPALPLPIPPIQFAKPALKPLVPLPLAPAVPVVPAATPAVLRPGNSVHTSFFATYPRHPLVPVASVAPVAPAVHFAPVAPPVAPLVPALHGTIPLNAPHPVAHFPVHVAKFPVNIIHPAPHHVHHPINVLHQEPPHQLHHQFNVLQHHQPLPVQHPVHVLHRQPQLHNPIHDVPLGIGEIPASLGQHHFFFNKPEVQLNQGQEHVANDNFHGLHAVGGDAPDGNVWTPMAGPSIAEGQFGPGQQLFENEVGHAQDQNQAYHYPAPDAPQFESSSQHQQHFQGNHFLSNVQHEQQQHHHSEQQANEGYDNHFSLRQHLPLDGPSENFAGYQ